MDVGTCKILLLCEEPLPRVPGMVNPGAHYRCLEAWGLFAVWEPNGAYNSVDTNVGALQYCLCQGGCEALLPQAYRVWS